MVDFKKRIGKSILDKKINPIDIYDTLDRASDKGPLRPAQKAILNEWYSTYKSHRDVVLKLHTGQGKTLAGLLILQSRINQDTGPAVYLCPNNHLARQTCAQADSFGINYVTINGEIPDQFVDGKTILIASAQMLFNGLTRFGIGARSMPVSTVLMDDAHTCIEVIKNACKITLKRDTQPYRDLLELFGPELEKQGVGTYADLVRGEYNALLPVPYWDWQDHHAEVARILSRVADSKDIRFAWPILKDMLRDCQCLISGESLEILPYQAPVNLYGSYHKASHRIFMSATLTDDSFLIRGLGVDDKAISDPLHFKDEKWSGEKMILIPSLIDETLTRTEIVNHFGKPVKERKYGVVALVPSFNGCKDWEKYGATIAKKETIEQEIERLSNKDCEKPLVIVNRYDGIDLPDNACRILVFDSKPYSESLYDRYLENTRTNSNVVAVRDAQTIEQGLGRAVRGEKDYCAIIVTGTELVKVLRSKGTRQYFSRDTRTQIEIGLKVVDFVKEDLPSDSEGQGLEVMTNLINQLLRRDEGWKEFYAQEMDGFAPEHREYGILKIVQAEKLAEDLFQQGDYQSAVEVLQQLVDKHITSDEEKGWYLQEMARYIYPQSKNQSNQMQINAHRKNRYLLKPKEGMAFSKISEIGVKRIYNIIKWISQHETFEDLQIQLENTLSGLRFGVKADRFEQALNELSEAIGFIGERPDKEWKEGPDNLWKVRDNEYILFECKNEVDSSRREIHKDETGQMNNACAWFRKHYGDAQVKRIMVIPTKKVANAAGFNFPVEVMRDRNLRKLVANVRAFFLEFKGVDLRDLSEPRIQELINLHSISVDKLCSDYSESVSMIR